MIFIECLFIRSEDIGSPTSHLSIGLCLVSSRLRHTIIRFRNITTPSIEYINRNIGIFIVAVSKVVSEVCLESQTIKNLSLDVAVDTSKACYIVVITSLLLVSNTVHTVYWSAISIKHVTVRTEEATPAPHISICITPSVRHIIGLVHEIEAETCFQPIGQSYIEVSVYIVTLQLIRVEVHLTFLF